MQCCQCCPFSFTPSRVLSRSGSQQPAPGATQLYCRNQTALIGHAGCLALPGPVDKAYQLLQSTYGVEVCAFPRQCSAAATVPSPGWFSAGVLRLGSLWRDCCAQVVRMCSGCVDGLVFAQYSELLNRFDRGVI